MAGGGSSNTQTTICDESPTCGPLAIGSSNTQTSTCVGAPCFVQVVGDSNTQTMSCRANCANSFDGNSNTQNVACNGGFCGNNGFFPSLVNSNTQNTACQSSGCLNNGLDTNVYANSASDIWLDFLEEDVLQRSYHQVTYSDKNQLRLISIHNKHNI